MAEGSLKLDHETGGRRLYKRENDDRYDLSFEVITRDVMFLDKIWKEEDSGDEIPL